MKFKQPVDTGTYSWLILGILSLMWGSSFILIKKGLVAFDPGTVGALRIASASIFLLPMALKRVKYVQKKHFIKLLTVGFAGSLVPAFLYAKAQTQIDSAVAGVLNALTPLWVIIIGILIFSHGITVRVLSGMVIGFAGTVWLVMAGSGDNVLVNYYALYIIAATICYGINLNLIKYKLADLSASTITSISLVMVGPLAAAFLLMDGKIFYQLQQDPFGWWSFASVGLLGVMGTAIALVLFNKLVQVTTPVFASTVTYLIPIVAVIWGILDGEKLVTGQIAGMALILSGVFIANRK